MSRYSVVISRIVVLLLIAVLTSVASSPSANAAPLVIGKRYPLNSKAQRGTLVWQFVVFNKSISGGVEINLEVYNKRAKSIAFFDDYRNIVDDKIQKNTISKFSMREASVNFSSDRYAEVSFQVAKLEHLYYIPLRVQYPDGFEDYLVRLHLAGGKLSMASRLLQHGKVVDGSTDEPTAPGTESKEPESKKTQSTETNVEEVKEIDKKQETPGLEAAPLDSELQENPADSSLKKDEGVVEELDPALLAPLHSPSSDLSEMLGEEKEDPSYQDTSDIQFDLPSIDDKKEEEVKDKTEPSTEE